MNASGYFIAPDLYDQLYAPFVADVGVIVDEAKAAGGPTLEVCCGSGRLLLPMLQAGVDADGIDYDAPMLDSLRAKLAARDLRSGVQLADMRSFDLPRRYALVVVGFNSFLHNLTQHDQLRTLGRVRHHLAPRGHLALMCFHPRAQRLAAADGTPLLALDSVTPEGHVRAFDAMTADRVRQLNQVTRRVERLDPDGNVVESRELAFSLRYVYTPEMELLLRVAGFTRWEVCSPISSYSGQRYPEPHAPEDGGVHLWRAWAD